MAGNHNNKPNRGAQSASIHQPSSHPNTLPIPPQTTAAYSRNNASVDRLTSA